MASIEHSHVSAIVVARAVAIRVTKVFTTKERYHLNVFGEFFNVLNIGNLQYGTQTLISPLFGQPTARVGQGYTFGSGGPRAVQVGARFIF